MLETLAKLLLCSAEVGSLILANSEADICSTSSSDLILDFSSLIERLSELYSNKLLDAEALALADFETDSLVDFEVDIDSLTLLLFDSDKLVLVDFEVFSD